MVNDRHLYDSVANKKNSMFEYDSPFYSNWVFGLRHITSLAVHMGVIAKYSYEGLVRKKEEPLEPVDPYDCYTQRVVHADGTEEQIPINRIRMAELRSTQDQRNKDLLDERGENRRKSDILERIKSISPYNDSNDDSVRFSFPLLSGVNHTMFFGTLDVPGLFNQMQKYNESFKGQLEYNPVISGSLVDKTPELKKLEEKGFTYVTEDGVYTYVTEDGVYFDTDLVFPLFSQDNNTSRVCSRCNKPIEDPIYFQLTVRESIISEKDVAIEMQKEGFSLEKIMGNQIDMVYSDLELLSVTRMHLHYHCAYSFFPKASLANQRLGDQIQLLSDIGRIIPSGSRDNQFGKDTTLEEEDSRDFRAVFSETEKIRSNRFYGLLSFFNPFRWKELKRAYEVNKNWKQIKKELGKEDYHLMFDGAPIKDSADSYKIK